MERSDSASSIDLKAGILILSVCRSGKRATINSYVYGDATAIARIAELAGREQLAEQFRQKAATLKHLVQTQLWDDEVQFFKTLPRSPYELTTFAWVATTKSVPSMTEKVLPRRRTLSTSGSSMVTHRNTFTGDWIARTHCEQRNAELKARGEENRILRERGKDYNHSSYCDLIITGLVGLRPREDDIIEVNPLVPADRWDWFCLDNVPYHGKTLTILWDKTGDRYGMGQGFRVFVDGKQIAQHDKLGHIQQ